jgi:hypothetical protein
VTTPPITGENEFLLSPHYTDMTNARLRQECFCLEEERPKYVMLTLTRQ